MINCICMNIFFTQLLNFRSINTSNTYRVDLVLFFVAGVAFILARTSRCRFKDIYGHVASRVVIHRISKKQTQVLNAWFWLVENQVSFRFCICDWSQSFCNSGLFYNVTNIPETKNTKYLRNYGLSIVLTNHTFELKSHLVYCEAIFLIFF